jgi:hypothetical protein
MTSSICQATSRIRLQSTTCLIARALFQITLGIFLAETLAAAPPTSSFSERRDFIIGQVAADPQAAIKDHPFFVAQACFLAGKNEEGRAIARKGYLDWSAQDPLKVRATDFFRLWPAMDTYVRYKHLLDEESKAAFRKHITSIRCYSYSYTANLNMLMWTTRLLGGQEWGDAGFVPPSPKDTISHYKADPSIPIKTRLLRMIDAQAVNGGEEYASRPYGASNLAPILCLAQLAKDPELRSHARIAHETALARYAPVWLDGAMVITSRRSYPDIFEDPMGCAEWFWVFFGGKLIPGAGGHALEAAVLGEAAPLLIERAAAARTTSYMVHNRFQEGSSGRQISWVDRTYGMFSESFHTKARAFGQTYPFGVRWIAPDSPGHTMLWFSVPALDEARKGKYPGSHPHGFDVGAQTTYQHEGALLYVVDTEAKKARYPYGLAFVPGGQLAVIDESATHGRVFLHYPGVLIAFSATKPFPWDRKAPIRYASGAPKAGDSEFRVPGPTFAAAIETAREDEVSAATPMERLKKFRATIVSKTHLRLVTEGGLAGSYQDSRGRVIRRAFDGAASIDAKPVDFDRWPLAESPWVRQADPRQPLTVTDGKTLRTHDFARWSITESQCKP